MNLSNIVSLPLFVGDVSAVDDCGGVYEGVRSSRNRENYKIIYEQSKIVLSVNIAAIAGKLYAAFSYNC